MASTISVLGEPERVNLVVRALKPDYLLLDIFLHLRSETWTQWTIEAALVKVYHRRYSFHHEDGPLVYPANAFHSFIYLFIHLFRQDCRKAKVNAYQSHAPD